MDGCHSKVNSARMLENISKIKHFDAKFTLVEISVWCREWLDKAVLPLICWGLALIKASLVAETFRNKYFSVRKKSSGQLIVN